MGGDKTSQLVDLKEFLNFTIGLAITLFAAVVQAASAPTHDEVEIQRWLTHHAQRVQGVESPAGRHRVVGDLDGDGRDDVALLYTLKPQPQTNKPNKKAAKSRASHHDEARYLAVFKRQREGLRYHGHVLVSGPGAGEANRATILERTVVVEMLTFKPGDAACCPTRATSRRYRLTPHGLALAQAVVKAEVAKKGR